MQIGRTLSLQNSSMIDGGSSAGLDQSLTLMSPGLSQYMLLDGSVREGSGQVRLGWVERPGGACRVCGGQLAWGRGAHVERVHQ